MKLTATFLDLIATGLKALLSHREAKLNHLSDEQLEQPENVLKVMSLCKLDDRVIRIQKLSSALKTS